MKKPKIKKKRGGYWVVYLKRNKKCVCYNERAARQWYEVLLLELKRQKTGDLKA